MRMLNLSNEKKRDAAVGFESLKQKSDIELVLPDGSLKQSARALKSTLATAPETLLARFGDAAALAKGIMESDPEVDLERFGLQVMKTRKVYLTTQDKVATASSWKRWSTTPTEVSRKPVPTSLPRPTSPARLPCAGPAN